MRKVQHPRWVRADERITRAIAERGPLAEEAGPEEAAAAEAAAKVAAEAASRPSAVMMQWWRALRPRLQQIAARFEYLVKLRPRRSYRAAAVSRTPRQLLAPRA